MPPRSLLVFALALALAAPGAAQDILDLPWRTDAAGQLQWQEIGPSPSDPVGRWQPMFPGLLDGARDTLTADDGHLECGVLMLLPLLLTGDGGAAAIDEAARRLRKLALLVSFDANAMSHVDDDPLLDLLRARHLGTFCVAAADKGLAEWARDARRDPFVRAAAYAELANRPDAAYWRSWDEVEKGRAERLGAPAVLAGLQRLPDDFDLLLGVHCAGLPTPASLLQAWRQVNVRIASSVVLNAGASLSPAGLRTGQSMIDYPGQLPYELAVRFGNWRVDQALLARRRGDAGWWFHLGGAFDPARLAAGLDRSGFDVTLRTDGTTEASVCGWQIRITRTTFEGWQEGAAITGRGSRAPELLPRATDEASPIWLHLPDGSDVATALHARLPSLDVQWHQATRSLQATAVCANDEAAVAVCAAWTQWQRTRSCDPDARIDGDRETTWRDLAENPPGVGEFERGRWVWRRCVQAVTCSVDANRVQWSCDLSPFALDDLVRLLRGPPLAWLRLG